MRAVFLEAPTSILDERRRLGLDGRDEMWDGVLHVVPPPGGPHQDLGMEFMFVVGPLAKRLGLKPLMKTGLFQGPASYRVPDQLFCKPEHFSDRGAEHAEAVVEIRSPGDQTYEKFSFYAAMGVQEMIILHPDDRKVEVHCNVGGTYIPAQPGAGGSVQSAVLGVTLTRVDGKLRITWPEGSAEI